MRVCLRARVLVGAGSARGAATQTAPPSRTFAATSTSAVCEEARDCLASIEEERDCLASIISSPPLLKTGIVQSRIRSANNVVLFVLKNLLFVFFSGNDCCCPRKSNHRTRGSLLHARHAPAHNPRVCNRTTRAHAPVGHTEVHTNQRYMRAHASKKAHSDV